MITTTAAAVKPGQTVRFKNIGASKRSAIRVERIRPAMNPDSPYVTLIGTKARVKDGVGLGGFASEYIRLDREVEVFEAATVPAEITARGVLAAHRKVWDMPTLATEYPEAIQWLSDRIEVHFGMVSEVIIVDKATGRATLNADTNDVRVAVERWLENNL